MTNQESFDKGVDNAVSYILNTIKAVASQSSDHDRSFVFSDENLNKIIQFVTVQNDYLTELASKNSNQAKKVKNLVNEHLEILDVEPLYLIDEDVDNTPDTIEDGDEEEKGFVYGTGARKNK